MNSLVIAASEFKKLFKQKSSILFLILLPVFVGIFVMAVSGVGGTKTKIAYENLDNGTMGREIVKFLNDSGKYTLIEASEEGMEKDIESKNVSLGIVIPENLSAQTGSGSPDRIKLISFRPSLKAEELSGILNSFMQAVSAGKALNGSDKAPVSDPIPTQARMYLGFMMMIMMIFVGMCIGTILEERKEKTFMRLFSTPVKSYEVVLGKMSAYYIIGLVQIFIFLLLTKYVFRFEIGIPMWKTAFVFCAFLAAALGLGIGVSGFITDNQKYVGLVTLVVVPATFFGGCFFPVSMLPSVVQKASNILPQKWAMAALEKLAAGRGLSEALTEIGVLILFGIVFFTFGTRTLKPSGEDL